MRKQMLALLLIATATLTLGCVERELLIRTEPAGAPVWVDEEYVGLSPIVYPFHHYGTRRLRVGPIREAAPAQAEPAAPAGQPAVQAPGTGAVAEKPVPPSEAGRELYRQTERLFTTRVPWYEVYPIDFFFEVLWPFKIVSHHEADLRLSQVAEEPEPAVDAAKKLALEAEQFRQKALSPALPGEP